MVVEGAGRVHHFEPLPIIEPFAAQFALPIALEVFHFLISETKARPLPSRVRSGEIFADVFPRLPYQPSIGGLFNPSRLIRAGIGNTAFPTRHGGLFGRGETVKLARPQRFMARAVIDGVRGVTRFTSFKT
jgi:hypothetical protein